MSSVPVPKKETVPRPAVVLEGIGWKAYTQLLRFFAERHERLTYDQGRLEIMSPLWEHDDVAGILGRFVIALTEELNLPIHSCRSTTLRRRLHQRGIEADDSFWIANAHRIAGVRRLDLRRHPPPDLAIEVDVTHSSLDRLGIYATLGVPEVWRFDDGVLTFYALEADGQYTMVERSRSFPMVAPADLLRFLTQVRAAGNQNPVMQRFREWVRRTAAGERRGKKK